jgi:NADP-dependent 3-hydroxy acid dehydrogenase YdfG
VKKRSHEGKLALVTGSGSGIGRATAIALAESGARVIAGDIDADRVRRIEKDLGAQCVLASTVDVGDRNAMCAFATTVHQRFGPLDILVNNAGVGHSGGMVDTPLEQWDARRRSPSVREGRASA